MTKSLSKAIALATLVGAAASAQAAVNVNPDGLGEVLLYSLYSAEQNNITNINITNTTNRSKVVKVRFVEGQNSHEVLDFNLYLSPFDQWSGAVTATAEGAKLITADKSCTLPAIEAAGVDFRDLDYLGDGGDQTLARTRVGHFEAIEMGEFEPTINNLLPVNLNHAVINKDCQALDNSFEVGSWSTAPQAGLIAPTGGLYGTAEIMNIEESTVISYDAVALQGFTPTNESRFTGETGVETALFGGALPMHAKTGSIYTNLNGNIRAPLAVENGVSPSRTTNWAVINGNPVRFDSTIQAISAVLAKNSIHNNYVIDDGRASATNWVITFPTKRFHVDATMVNGLAFGNATNAVIIGLEDRVTLANARLQRVLAATPTDATQDDEDAGNAPGASITTAVAGVVLTVEEARETVRFAEAALRLAMQSQPVNNRVAPFTTYWAGGTACEDIAFKIWDNDEKVSSTADFSPSRPGGPQLCYETNILTFNDEIMVGGSLVTSNINLDSSKFPFGWMNVDFSAHALGSVNARANYGFDQATGTYQYRDGRGFDNSDNVVRGLPAIGFSASTFRNDVARPNTSNYYILSSEHKADKDTGTGL